MKKNEVKNSVSNVVVIESADSKLLLEVGNVYEFCGKKLSITNKRSHTEENPTTGKKTLWSGDVDGVVFTEVDSCKVRKLFGLAERKRESNGKVFIHEGYEYRLDDTTDVMIEYAVDRYTSLLSQLREFEKQYGFIKENQEEIDESSISAAIPVITKKIESVCLARKINEEEEKKRKETEKAEKAKASKERKENVKKAKVEFFALLSDGVSLSQVTDKIKNEFGLQLTDLA